MTQKKTVPRRYQMTHPWLTFNLDLRKASYRLWLYLGEAQSKCEHIAGVPLRPDTVDELHQLFLAKGALATTAIEGNTLSEDQVLQLLKGKLNLPPSKDYLRQEVENVVKACNEIGSWLITNPTGKITPELISHFNKLVLENLDLPPEVTPGKIRNYEVSVGHYSGAPAEDCQLLLEMLCSWLNGPDFNPSNELTIPYALFRAILAHLYLAWIHPFGDGNGRTARLVEFMILLSAGVPFPAAHLLSNHYNETRQKYYMELHKASASGGNVLPFIEYALQGFIDGLKDQLDKIRYQQWDVAWRNYVYEELSKQANETVRRRRRHLILDLSLYKEPVPLSSITNISPRVAKHYATTSSRTLLRDIDALEEEKLILRTRSGILANKSLILAFLPLCVETKKNK